MKADPKGVLTGIHFIDGDHATAKRPGRGHLGSSRAIHHIHRGRGTFAHRIHTSAVFVDGGRDHSSIAIQSAILGGRGHDRDLGPGPLPHDGAHRLAVIAGFPASSWISSGRPSTGLPTMPAQADMMQVKWGSHGDYEMSYLPESPQECFDLMIKTSTSRDLRVPVFFMMDEVVGYMVDAWPSDLRSRSRSAAGQKKPGSTSLTRPGGHGADLVRPGRPPHHITGLTHDERGYRPSTTAQKLVERLS